MDDEVAALVLRDNYEQAQAIATSAAQAASMLEVHERYLPYLEQSGVLNRELEFLPDDDVLADRRAAGVGLTPPELAILLSYTKIAFSEGLLASDLPEDPYFELELERYFPTRLREQFGAELQRHPLRREIIVSRVVNDLVNRTGTTFAFRLHDETGASAADIARAYTAAREVFGLRELWAEIEALDGQVAAAAQVRMFLRVRVLLERTTRWLLRNRRRPLDVAGTVAYFQPGAAALAGALHASLGAAELESSRVTASELSAAGVPESLAGRVSEVEELVPALDIVEIAVSTGLDVLSVAKVYHALGSRLDLHWLRGRIVALPRETRWEAMARAALRDDLYAEQAALTAEVVRGGSDGMGAAECVQTWFAHNADSVERSAQMMGDIKSGESPDLAQLSVAVREIRNLIHLSEAPEGIAPESAGTAQTQ
jgi:glutamate dehydrogenase